MAQLMALSQDSLQLSALSGVSSVAEGCLPKIMSFLGTDHIQFLVQDGVEKPDPFVLPWENSDRLF